jgi:hypothetical protein
MIMTNDNKMNVHKIMTKSLICYHYHYKLSFCHHFLFSFLKTLFMLFVIIFFLYLLKT